MENRIVNLRLDDFEKEGLYLLFSDSTKLELTKENIEKVTDQYLKQTFWEPISLNFENPLKSG